MISFLYQIMVCFLINISVVFFSADVGFLYQLITVNERYVLPFLKIWSAAWDVYFSSSFIFCFFLFFDNLGISILLNFSYEIQMFIYF